MLNLNLAIAIFVEVGTSVVDPKLFIPYPDPALNFPSSGSGSGSRQKFRIHADPDPDTDPTCINNVSKIRNNTKNL